MWSCAAGGASIAAAGYAYHCYCEFHTELIDHIESILRIEDAVHMLKIIAHGQSTESVTDSIANAIGMNGISESALCRLSELHRQYGADDGCNGYAINMLWSTVLDSIARGAVILVQ